MDIAWEEVDAWVGARRVQPVSLNEYIGKFNGARRTRLVKACNNAIVNNHLPFGVTGFVKCDKYDLEAAETKAPRMIQFRGPATNAALARVMEPAEHTLLYGPGLGPSATPDCSKGMDHKRLAQVWHTKRYAIPDSAALLGDYSKFDSHVHTHVLELEHAVWRAVSGMEMRLLDNQLINSGHTGPLRYTAVGTRMSGDRNTGGGNSVINILIFRVLKRVCNIDLEILCDGDDSVVWCARKHLPTLIDAAGKIIPRVFGMRWTHETAEHMAAEEYCHRALSYDGDEPRLIADPIRTLRRAFWVVNEGGGKQLGRILVGNLISIYLMFPRCPVLSRVTWGLLEQLSAIDDQGVVVADYHSRSRNTTQYTQEIFDSLADPHKVVSQSLGRLVLKLPRQYLDVSAMSRHDMAASFGISHAEQCLLERELLDGVVNPSLRITPFKTPPMKKEAEVLVVSNDHTVPEYG
jgi:hypothetical protein